MTARVRKLRNRVKRGIALIILEAAKGWKEKLRLDDLNSESDENSILGQVFGSHAVGLRKLKHHSVTAENAHTFGFGVSGKSDDDSFSLDYVWEKCLSSE